MAEGIFDHLTQQAGLQDQIGSDSAGTGTWHIGQPANHNTLKVLQDHGIAYGGRARQLAPEDFEEFDHIVAMDESNYEDAVNWAGSKPEKVSLMLDWHPSTTVRSVPDPYYGGVDGFEHVYELLVPACQGLLDHLRSNQ